MQIYQTRPLCYLLLIETAVDLFSRNILMSPVEMSFYREYTTCLVGKSKRTSENSREEQIKQKTYSRQILAPGKLKSNRC